MSQGYTRKFTGALLCAAILFVAPASVWADGSPKENPKEAQPLNLARLAAVLQAASERKQSGSEVILKKDIRLRGRPTGEALESSLLPAGTVVRKSKRQVVNASGSWRHIETRDGNDGWIHDFDIDPD